MSEPKLLFWTIVDVPHARIILPLLEDAGFKEYGTSHTCLRKGKSSYLYLWDDMEYSSRTAKELTEEQQDLGISFEDMLKYLSILEDERHALNAK